jgi:phosphomannomutase
MFLDRMAATGQTISELASKLPRYFRKIGKVPYEHGQLGTVMQQLEDSFPEAATDRTDGLKLMWPGRWIHVRASNTEPILRFSAEAQSAEQTDELYGSVERLLR